MDAELQRRLAEVESIKAELAATKLQLEEEKKKHAEVFEWCQELSKACSGFQAAIEDMKKHIALGKEAYQELLKTEVEIAVTRMKLQQALKEEEEEEEEEGV